MKERRPIPQPGELSVALEAFIDLQLDPFADEDEVARAAAVLTLECVGGPEMPSAPDERDERLRTVRELLGKQVGRFADLPESELEERRFRYTHEAQRLEDAATAMLQLNLPKPDASKRKGDLWAAANAIWDKQPSTRWYQRYRDRFAREKLSEWIIEAEDTYREAHRRDDELPQRDQVTKSRDQQEPEVRLVEAEASSKARSLKRLLVGSGVALATILMIWLAATLLSSDGEPIPIEKQITDNVSGSGTVRMLREVYLHDAATPSYLVVVRRPPPRSSSRQAHLPKWDEVRIYDQAGGDAALRLVAQPVALVGGAPRVNYNGLLWGNRTGRMYQFRLLGVHDTNNDGRAEIYGSLTDQISSVTRPLAIEWNGTTDEYQMVPLAPNPPKAPVWGEGHPGLGVASWGKRESQTPLRVYVGPAERHVALYGATEVAIRHVPELGWLLVSGYGAVSGRKIVTREAEGHRRVGRGLNFKWNSVTENVAAITLLTVEVARLQDADGLVEPQPCDVLASSRIRPDLVVPKLTTNALVSDPLAPQRLDLAEHVYCQA